MCESKEMLTENGWKTPENAFLLMVPEASSLEACPGTWADLAGHLELKDTGTV